MTQSSIQNKETHPWRIYETEYQPEQAAHYGTLFSLANGYLGIRASQEDSPLPEVPCSDGVRGTFINGYYDTKPIEYGEVAYGYAVNAETMQNIANPLPLRVFVDDELFDLNEVHAEKRLLQYERVLDMKEGFVERLIQYKTKSGKVIELKSKRIVCFQMLDGAAMRYEISSPEGEVEVRIESLIDGATMNKSGGEDSRLPKGSLVPILEIIHHELNDKTIILGQKAPSSQLEVFVANGHECHQAHSTSEDKTLVFANRISKEPFVLDQFFSFKDTRRAENQNLKELVERNVQEMKELGFEALCKEQSEYLKQYWHYANIEIKGDELLEQGLHFSSYHLLQAAGRDGLCSVSAKGLSGEGYEGHYFWDTEMYVFPYFLYTQVDVAKSILDYRYSTLPIARERAKIMGMSRGAQYPWRTISGHECSPYYPAGTAQIHINGDIALAVQRYIDVSGDKTFLIEKGLEMLIETAVLFLDVGFYDDKKGFVLHEVTGPDEYTTMVNNNYYTNLLAKYNFDFVIQHVADLEKEDLASVDALFEKLGYDKHELISKFQEASDKMYFPYSEELGISLQDDSFAEKEPWNFLEADPEKYPLLLHYHPIVIYRHRVSKQADMILAQSIDTDRFDYEDLRKSFQYYELTQTHDSSLSVSTHSIMANHLDQSAKAFSYFMKTARLDIEDHQGNTDDGLHFANMAGTWMALTAGYLGMQRKADGLSFTPHIPEKWEYYTLRIHYQNSLLGIRVEQEKVVYELLEGDSISFKHMDEQVELTSANKTIELVLAKNTQNNVNEIKAAIFDVDGVLLSTDEQHYQAWQRLADELGIYFDRTVNQRFRGVSRMACMDILIENEEKEYTLEEKTTLANRKNDYYVEQINQLDETALLPGVKEFLQKLKDLGILIATGSSSKNAETLLTKTGITEYFDAQVDGRHISHSKPDPEVFVKAGEALGVAPENCVVFEDAVAGIEAANAANMRSIAMGHIAPDFLKLGAQAGAWTLADVFAEDLSHL